MTRRSDIAETERLGRGLLGTTHRAEIVDREDPVALKVLDPAPPADREAFRQYVESLVRLDHPHLVHYLEPLDETSPFALLEAYVEGVDIATYMQRGPTNEELGVLRRGEDSETEEIAPKNGGSHESSRAETREDAELSDTDLEEASEAKDEPLELTDVADRSGSAFDLSPDTRLDLALLRLERLVPQIVSALQYLHRFRTPHGTLKPSNILIDDSGRCRLADFGLVEHLKPFEYASSSDDAEPEHVATLDHARAYRAPELAPGDAPTPAADRYALGCMLFELIAGGRPFEPSGSQGPRGTLEASALSELEPRCPTPWVDLVMRLLDADPDDRPPLEEIESIVESSRTRSVDIPPTFVPEQESFFGREHLFEQLVDDIQTNVRGDTLGISLLSGAAGVGKTALAKHAAHWASKRGWLVLRGHCHRRESGIYQGWNEIGAQLRDICDRTEGEMREQLDPIRQRASRLLPILTGDSDEADLGGEDQARRRHEAVAALRQLLRVVSSQRPILMLLDDVDWASRDTASLLIDLIMEPEDLQCVILGTWRSGNEERSREEGLQLLEAIRDAPVSVQWREIRPFSTEEARRYAETTGPHLSEKTRERLLTRSHSNPLLLEELLYQTHLAADRDEGDETFPVFVGESPDEHPESPPDIESQLSTLVASRLEVLSRRERFVVELLSVASLPLSERIVSLALDEEFHSPDPMGLSARDVLERLRRLRLVKNTQTHRWDRAYALFHELGRQLVLEEIPEQRYTHLCGHIADAFQRLHPEADGLRFEYLLRADRSPEAVDKAVSHAHHAESCYAYHRASKLWRWIADRPGLTTRLTSLDPRRELARAERLAGRPGEAARLLTEIASDLPEGLQRTRLEADAFEAHLAAGDRQAALDSLKRALAHYGDRYDNTSLVTRLSEWKHRAIAATNRWSDELDRTSIDDLGFERSLQIRLYRRVVLLNDVLDSTRGARFRAKLSATAERSKHALLLGLDRFLLGRECHAHRLYRRPERAHEWYDQAEYLFERASTPIPLAIVELARADLHRKAGRFEASREALEHADEAATDSERRHDVDFLVLAESARLHAEEGAYTKADREARRLLHYFRGNALAAFRAHQILIPLCLVCGEVDRAEILVERCREVLEATPPALADVWLARQTTRLNLALGRPEVALGQLDVLRDRFERTRLFNDSYPRGIYHLSVAQAAVALAERKHALGEGRRRDLHARIDTATGRLQSVIDEFDPPLYAEICRLFARVELARENLDEADRAIDRALQKLASYPNPIARTLCSEAQGVIYKHRASGEGTSLIEQSYILYDHHGCRAPLVLEGWPIPERHSSLHPDD